MWEGELEIAQDNLEGFRCAGSWLLARLLFYILRNNITVLPEWERGLASSWHHSLSPSEIKGHLTGLLVSVIILPEHQT